MKSIHRRMSVFLEGLGENALCGDEISLTILNGLYYDHFGLVFLCTFILALGGAVAGAVVSCIYNIVAGMMGGLKLSLG